MGSAKKSKDKDRDKNKEEKRKRRHARSIVETQDRDKHKDKDKEKDREGRRHHRHHRKHKKHRSKKRVEDRSRSHSQSASQSDDSFSEDDLIVIPDDNEEEEVIKMEVPPPPRMSRQAPPPPQLSYEEHYEVDGKGAGDCLTVEETNKIRAKLGLKPLQVDQVTVSEDKEKLDAGRVDNSSLKEDDSGKVDLDAFVHKPAENLAQKIQVEKLREKIKAQREKRKIYQKLTNIKKLADSDEDDSALAWIEKSRKLEHEKQLAEQRNKMLEELDEQFGIGDLVEQEMIEEQKKKYTRKNLTGLKIEHKIERFDEGNVTILTLKDSNVLGEDEDMLVNVNMLDDEIVERNLKRKRKKDDIEYDAPQVDEFGNILQNTILTKYDEEIEGEKKNCFRIGAHGTAYVENDDYDEYANGPQGLKKVNKMRKLEKLDMAAAQLATEYFTPGEMVQFKKVKKKKKKRKKFSLSDLQPLENDPTEHLASRDMIKNWHEAAREMWGGENGIGFSADTTKPVVSTKVKNLKELMEEDDEIVIVNECDDMELDEQEQDDLELQEALARTRRAKQVQETKPSFESTLDVLKVSKKDKEGNSSPAVEASSDDKKLSEEDEEDILMTLNTTDEFCRTLGDIPTYGLSGNRADEDQSLLAQDMPRTAESSEPRGAWEEVGIDDTRVEILDNYTTPILEEEPDASKGVANALKLALKKGYLEKIDLNKSANAALQHLRAVHYSIEDKNVDDDRRGRGGDRYSGPVTDFKEKNNYRPEVKLDYVDDDGRKLNAKEAFRYLSHKFHGKGSGKNKTEKRMKKWEEEALMKHMSSSDTPLQTLERQREKQKQLGAAYLVLSGNKQQEIMEVKK